MKRSVAEPGSTEVGDAISNADVVGTALISRPEVTTALAKAVRVGTLTEEEPSACLQVFREEWPDLMRVQVTRDGGHPRRYARPEHNLRGHDPVRPAAASLWQDAMGERAKSSTFDRPPWETAKRLGLTLLPANLPGLLEGWKAAQEVGFRGAERRI